MTLSPSSVEAVAQARPLAESALIEALRQVRRPLLVMRALKGGDIAVFDPGAASLDAFIAARAEEGFTLAGIVPACGPDDLGDPAFRADHGVKFAYVTGAMANGIASSELVKAISKAGGLGFFGAAGQSLPRIEAALDDLQQNLDGTPYGFNLIHSPNEPELEARAVELYLSRNVHLVEASAYMDLTAPLVRFRVSGIHRDKDGRIVTPNRVMGKVSRGEVATRFFSPPPKRLLEELLAAGQITRDEAELAQHIPMAQDLTAEADSGGHTDNRPLVTLLPTLLALRDRLQAQFGYEQKLRVGAAGGISTPAAARAAFAMGAAYVVTGSVNQACVESGSSDGVRKMLAEADQADIIMAPAPDMFEMGVKVQVLKRGTMFAMRAAKLYEIYRTYGSIEAIPAAERAMLEKQIFRTTLDDIWQQTAAFFNERQLPHAKKAEQDPKFKLALICRWYLGLSSRWANSGEPTRQLDYQVWCGPAMGAFNEWVKGSFLEQPQARDVATVAHNILYHTALLTRAQVLSMAGCHLPPDQLALTPLPTQQLQEFYPA